MQCTRSQERNNNFPSASADTGTDGAGDNGM